MVQKLEIERKFLVKFPTSWSALSKMFDQLVDVKRISQTYLSAKDNEPAARVRKTIEGLTGDTQTVYHYNKKNHISTGVHKELEKEISKSEYEKMLKKCDPNKTSVEKTRFVFKFKDQTFELDVFKKALSGLAILEIELENKKNKVVLPDYLKVIKEVTEDSRYNNYSLADKKLHSKITQK